MCNYVQPTSSALDQCIAPNLRLWMLIGLIGVILLIMVVIVCCFMRIRIPRTKRQIELIAARRKMRKRQANGTATGPTGGGVIETHEHHDQPRGQTIVLNSYSRGGDTRKKDTSPLVAKGIPV
uniref:Transmembrane protein n=1 Tax=Acrobeloides nanus TaxID=290746 RepID=A0A914BV69_9BILA